MAPEIKTGNTYEGRSADLFAAGVVLFMLLAGSPPFSRTESDDVFYSKLTEKSDLFWKVHSKGKEPGFFSDSFKDLFSSLVSANVSVRPNLE